MLARFVIAVVEKKGWWFRLPKCNTNGKYSYDVKQDIVMPQLGRLFGLAEEAAALVLVKMGLMTRLNDGTVIFREQGWNEFSSTFMVGDVVETCKVSFDGKPQYYVRIGLVDPLYKSAVTVWKQYKKNKRLSCPVSLCNRKTSAFISGELRSILVQSEFFDTLSNIAYYGGDGEFGRQKMLSAKEKLNKKKHVNNTQQPDSDSSDSGDDSDNEETENTKKTDQITSECDIKCGEIADVSTYPV